MKENCNPINEIREVLKRFQQAYDSKNIESAYETIKEFFIDEEDTSLVGTGARDWYFGLSGISEAIKKYWTDDNEYLKNIELDIDNSVITITGEAAVVALSAKSTSRITTEKLYDDMVLKIKRELREKDNEKIELLNVSQRIARAFYEANLGEEFIWPFRGTFFMIKNNSKWMFKHVKLSFGANNGWETWFTNENIDSEFKRIPVKASMGSDADEVRELLRKIQHAYDKRDVNVLDAFTEEVFTRDENSYIFGTDEGENFKGINAGHDLCKGDWIYWGDFDINADNAYIGVYGSMAFVYSKAFLREIKNRQGTYNSLGDLYHNYLLPSEEPSKEKLLRMLWKTAKRVRDAEYEGDYIVPMKFAGVLVKVNNMWKFQHMHFSDNIDEMPEERII